MNDRLIQQSTVTRRADGYPVIGFPKQVDGLLGNPESICWFLEEDTGLVYVVPGTEVAIR